MYAVEMTGTWMNIPLRNWAINQFLLIVRYSNYTMVVSHVSTGMQPLENTQGWPGYGNKKKLAQQ